ncbi:acetyl-CoA acetyltransferase [Glaciibacter psychrotolerans]|uniref:propanoyl-CoA C-acyltransferase n=1 Tax=Glaciibacter psychrotolerans TaxID=670054 RepID=A0A7Z0EDK2_9MICO|nr:acetyl-CoA acetyltransferase [Leifsonia psychrotolerans]NYJ19677.1 acetyl-CoA C-acetyltransferase [Leifsonia psychrotolerans]
MNRTNGVYLLGGSQTDFARNISTEGTADPLFALLREAALGAIEDAAIDARDVQRGHVGNHASELFTGQSHLGAMLPAVTDAWRELPSSRHEAACASGSMAALGAMADIEAGLYDVVLVVGVEQMRNVPGRAAAHNLGAASWRAREDLGELAWPTAFDRVANEITRRYGGMTREHLSRLVQNSRENARRNPLAQTRTWIETPASFADDDDTNPVIIGSLRKSDCGRISDGASAVVFASRDYAERWRTRHGHASMPPRLTGWGHRTSSMSLDEKLAASVDSPYLFPHLRTAITDSYTRAGLRGIDELDAIELHDCFSVSSYLAVDHLGITAPGLAWQAVEDGRMERGGAIPVNPSGGLLSGGHPVGATGVRMLNDARRQVTGQAGAMQVEGAQNVATLNFGGSVATVASFVVGQDR